MRGKKEKVPRSSEIKKESAITMTENRAKIKRKKTYLDIISKEKITKI